MFDTEAYYVYLRRDDRGCLVFYPEPGARDGMYNLFAYRINRRMRTQWRVVAGAMPVVALEALRTKWQRGKSRPWSRFPPGSR